MLIKYPEIAKKYWACKIGPTSHASFDLKRCHVAHAFSMHVASKNFTQCQLFKESTVSQWILHKLFALVQCSIAYDM
jgi:hypothetical protein